MQLNKSSFAFNLPLILNQAMPVSFSDFYSHWRLFMRKHWSNKRLKRTRGWKKWPKFHEKSFVCSWRKWNSRVFVEPSTLDRGTCWTFGEEVQVERNGIEVTLKKHMAGLPKHRDAYVCKHNNVISDPLMCASHIVSCFLNSLS